MTPERRAPKGRWITLAAVLVLCGCWTPRDYSAYLQHMPRSILVLPPLNNSVEPTAPYIYISTVSRPLAERGYYLFPVAVIDLMMKENGLPTPGEMHQVSLAKIDEILGADAVLYVTIEEWGTEYHIISSSTKVQVLAALVDVKTGKVLWAGRHAAVNSSGGGDLILAPIVALIHQLIYSIADVTDDLSETVNRQMFGDSRAGLLLGHYHPRYAEDQERRQQDEKKRLRQETERQRQESEQDEGEQQAEEDSDGE